MKPETRDTIKKKEVKYKNLIEITSLSQIEGKRLEKILLYCTFFKNLLLIKTHKELTALIVSIEYEKSELNI